MESLLSIKNLSVGFAKDGGWSPFLKHIDAEIANGGSLGVVGESGSGKSLLCYSIMRLLDFHNAKPLGGKILLEGKDLLELPEDKMRLHRGKDMAMVFQEPMSSLNPVLTIGYQVTEVLRLHEGLSKKEAWQQTVELLAQVGLPEPKQRASDYPHQLSGGQRQRVMIAMAMACRPRLIIADEPTTALDVTVQKQILDLLLRLRQNSGTALLFVSHDLAVVQKMTDAVCVMRHGEIVESGPASKVFQAPSHSYTQALIRSRISNAVKGQAIESAASGKPNISKNENKPQTVTEQEFTSQTLVKVSNLSKRFSGRTSFWKKSVHETQALDSVDLEIHRGQVLGLVGESGSGKTTLGRILLRLDRPDEGQACYRDQDIHQLGRKALFQFRRQAQVIFQDPLTSLNPRYSVSDTLTEALKTHKLHSESRSQRVEELVELVGLPKAFQTKYPHMLSGGERQRVCIARALAVEPEFLVCDEPVSSLDASIRGRILNLLSDLRRELQLTYLFISHDLEVVNYFCDEVAVMKAGQVLEKGSVETVFSNPQHEYTRSLIDAIPKWID